LAGDAAGRGAGLGRELIIESTVANRQVALLGLPLVLASITMLIGYHKIAAGLDAQFVWFKEFRQCKRGLAAALEFPGFTEGFLDVA
jgi:hypothetical protein